ncbi:serine/threonine-protein kinase [Streptomyces sp. NPDC101118]|uniref:serine/threonine-protein kinase n=1 Tax=Streptomyces sp. NPDC101118 TaxID=3366109 RepID=UPI003815B00F
MRGRLLGGRYRLGKRLGAGGMGVVWEAHDDLLHRTVAVKVLPDTPETPEALARLEREARAAAGLSENRHVVTVHDFGREAGTAYVVMERVRGHTLDELLRRWGPPAPARAVEWTRQVCVGLAAAHAAGVVHRDVKPSNVIVTPDLSVKILDFGIAWFHPALGLERLTGGSAIGSAPWMSPEQIQAGRIDHRTDLYSVGCLLFELLTGRPPFGDRQLHSQFVAHVTEAPVAPGTVRADLPPVLDELVLALLAKSPDDRPQRAADVAARLGGIAGELGAAATSPHPPGPPSVPAPPAAAATEPLTPARDAAPAGRPTRTRTRTRIRAVPVAAVAVVLAAGLTTALVWMDGRNDPSDTGRAGSGTTAGRPTPSDSETPRPKPEPGTNTSVRFPRTAAVTGPLQNGWRTVHEEARRFTIAVPADYERTEERAGVLYTGPGSQIVVTVYHEFDITDEVQDDLRDQLKWYQEGADGTMTAVRSDGVQPATLLGVPGWTFEATYHKTGADDPGSRHRRIELAATDSAREQVYFRVEFPDVPDQRTRAMGVLAAMRERMVLRQR